MMGKPITMIGDCSGIGKSNLGAVGVPQSSDTVNTIERYEYVPMNMPYNGIGIGYGFGEGVGIGVSGGLRGHVVIHEYSQNQVDVIVFSDTAVRKQAPNSWRQATVELVKEGKVLASQVVKKYEPYTIAEDSRNTFWGSAKLTLPVPVDLTPVYVYIKVNSTGIFPEGVSQE
jgi:hypothetical protein